MLYLLSINNKGHCGIDATLAKARNKCWILGARWLIKAIRKRCVTCRKKQKIIQGLLLDRLRPSTAFYYTAVDLFGPFTIRDPVKERTHGNAFGVIFTF